MMKNHVIRSCCLTCCLLVGGSVASVAAQQPLPVVPPGGLRAAQPNDQEDAICRLLFDAYVAGGRGAKVATSTKRAVAEILAERGHAMGFWNVVLGELQKNNSHSEVDCITVLGKMLAIDADARTEIQRRRETGKDWPPLARSLAVRIGPEVASAIIARADKADASPADHYAIALARARVPEARSFFTEILTTSARAEAPPIKGTFRPSANNPLHSASTQFHAAVGLALLAEPAGIEWLIANSESTSSVFTAWPALVWHQPAGVRGDVGVCCVAALQQLADRRDLASKSDWEGWWHSADRKTLAFGHVTLIESF